MPKHLLELVDGELLALDGLELLGWLTVTVVDGELDELGELELLEGLELDELGELVELEPKPAAASMEVVEPELDGELEDEPELVELELLLMRSPSTSRPAAAWAAASGLDEAALSRLDSELMRSLVDAFSRRPPARISSGEKLARTLTMKSVSTVASGEGDLRAGVAVFATDTTGAEAGAGTSGAGSASAAGSSS